MQDINLLLKLKTETENSINYQKRRHSQWEETYALSRDIVETNEITQTQEVNVPIMKETKKTISSRIDDAPDVEFQCLEGGEDGKIKSKAINAIYSDVAIKQNFEIKDIIDKNNVLFFGRSFKKLNFVKGEFKVDVLDNLDIVVDPKMIPVDIESAKHLHHLHIRRTLNEILKNPEYDEQGKVDLFFAIDQNKRETGGGGLLNENTEAEENSLSKERILLSLGVTSLEDIDTFENEVELIEHCTTLWEKGNWVRYVILTDNMFSAILSKKTLDKALGIDFWPYVTWADDPDTKDVWTDGICDIVRTPNKIMNGYFSSWIQNRALRNFGMTYYLPGEGYDPSTFDPEPFGQYPAPAIKDKDGRYMSIRDVVMQMEIPALDDNVPAIEFLIKLVERATAATAIEKGTGSTKQMTLGEVEEIVQNSAERITSMAKFYRKSWEEFAWKWRKIMEANLPEESAMKLYKEGTDGSIFEKEIYKEDWFSDKGYREKVVSKSEKQANQINEVNKILLVKNQYPNNKAIQKIAQKRLVDLLDLSTEEMREVMDEQKLIDSQPQMTEVAPNNQNQAGMSAMPK